MATAAHFGRPRESTLSFTRRRRMSFSSNVQGTFLGGAWEADGGLSVVSASEDIVAAGLEIEVAVAAAAAGVKGGV